MGGTTGEARRVLLSSRGEPARARRGESEKVRPRTRRNLSNYSTSMVQMNLLPPFAAAAVRAVLPIYLYWQAVYIYGAVVLLRVLLVLLLACYVTV